MNCPPPPEPEKPKKDEEKKHGDEGHGDEESYENAQLPGVEDLPPGQAKKLEESFEGN